LEYKVISTILSEARKILNEENLLLEFSNEVKKQIYIIGDIHGNLESLSKMIDLFKLNKPQLVIFLGDIVDRGPNQLECLITVLILKILEPNIYFLLKGNHETLDMNKYYGFHQEFTERFQNEANFDEILDLYNALPYVARINKQIICVHGGIPEDIDFLNKLNGLKTKDLYKHWKNLSEQLLQITWNDPKENIEGFIESFRGPGIKFFGEDVFEEFMEKNNLKYLIRSHEMFQEGYRWFFKYRLLSIFSSENYGGYSRNPGSYVIINENNEVMAKLLK
jgi:serine/threonine-protein phosphatase PP1 catalytic subunit